MSNEAMEAFETSVFGLKAAREAQEAASVAKDKAERVFGHLQILKNAFAFVQQSFGCDNCKSNPCRIKQGLTETENTFAGMRVKASIGCTYNQQDQMATVGVVNKWKVEVLWDSNYMSRVRLITKTRNPSFEIMCDSDC